MVQDKDGWRLPGERKNALPFMFSLRAKAP